MIDPIPEELLRALDHDPRNTANDNLVRRLVAEVRALREERNGLVESHNALHVRLDDALDEARQIQQKLQADLAKVDGLLGSSGAM